MASDPLSQNSQFQSRSLGTFNQQQQQQLQQSRDEINLSVKNVIKLLENNSSLNNSQPSAATTSNTTSTQIWVMHIGLIHNCSIACLMYYTPVN